MAPIGTLFPLSRAMRDRQPRPIGPASLRTTLACALLLLTGALSAQRSKEEPPLTRILFVMDASNSMNAFWANEPKIVSARRILLEALKPLESTPGVEVALRLYGHQTRIEPGKQDCDDTRLEVPFSPNNGKAIRDKLNTVYCLGTTPIARSLEKAAGDFPDRKARNVIILITDGIEACDEDPCAVSRALQSRGIVLKPFVIGVGIEENSAYNLKCVGNYYDASTPELFDRVLKVVIDQALNSTTTQLLLLTDDSKPTETNVPVTFYDQRTGQQRYNFVHTITSQGHADTLSIDPVFTYRIVAHTLPPSVKENVTIEPGQHNVIALMAGQGELELFTASGQLADHEVQCLVRRTGDPAILNVQRMHTRDRYRTGSYDLEFLTLPRLVVPDVMVRQSVATPVRIPQSGVLNVSSAAPLYGAVMLKKGDVLEWVVDLDPTMTTNQFRLLPGDYKLILRPVKADHALFSVEKDFSILSGRPTNLDL